MTETNQRRVSPGMLTIQRSGQGSRIMSTTSIGRIAVLYLALVAACVAALVVGFTHLRREPPVETRAATTAPAVSPPASGARDEGSAALATAQAEANAVAAAPAVSPARPTPMKPCPSSTLPALSEQVTRAIAARRR